MQTNNIVTCTLCVKSPLHSTEQKTQHYELPTYEIELAATQQLC